MPTPSLSVRAYYPIAGVLATLAGVAAGHLTAALLTPAASPVLAVGSAVIDLTPTPVKEYAVREFGTKDKPLLIGSVLLVALVLAAIAGQLAQRRLARGAGLLVILVAVAGLAAMVRPTARPIDALPALVSALVAVGALTWMVRARQSVSTDVSTSHEGSGDGPAPQRRTLLATGAVAAFAIAAGGAGTWIGKARTKIGAITFASATDPAGAFPEGLETQYPEISSLRTPTSRFYKVDTKLAVPIVDVDTWRLTINGDVAEPFSLSFDELAAMPLVERDITLTCVSNEVGGTYVGSARWLGVPVTALLDRARVGSKADQLLSVDVEGFKISTPLEVVRDGRDALVAIAMNGKPLNRDHGFPARLVTPGVYGFVGATKWLERLTLTTYAEEQAYWTERDWATDAPIKTAARIDTPKPLSRIKSGPTVVGGVAWAQQRGIKGVEVRVDGGEWQKAKLGPEVTDDYWRQWFLPWEASQGQHMLAVRATTKDGEVQTDKRATPFPAGSSGIQEIVVIVE
jgi:DMSO/TMAO reductase YedYZ molybdopterin-dependent catalytic subunit